MVNVSYHSGGMGPYQGHELQEGLRMHEEIVGKRFRDGNISGLVQDGSKGQHTVPRRRLD